MTGVSNKNAMDSPVLASKVDRETILKRIRKTRRGFRGGKNRNKSNSQKNEGLRFVFYFYL